MVLGVPVQGKPGRLGGGTGRQQGCRPVDHSPLLFWTISSETALGTSAYVENSIE